MNLRKNGPSEKRTVTSPDSAFQISPNALKRTESGYELITLGPAQVWNHQKIGDLILA